MRFTANAVRLQLHALACNLANFLRTLVTPDRIGTWSLTSLRERLIRTATRLVRHARTAIFRMAEARAAPGSHRGHPRPAGTACTAGLCMTETTTGPSTRSAGDGKATFGTRQRCRERRQAGVPGQADDVADIVPVASRQQPPAAEAAIRPDHEPRLGPGPAQSRNQQLHNHARRLGAIDVRRARIGHQKMVARADVKRQEAVPRPAQGAGRTSPRHPRPPSGPANAGRSAPTRSGSPPPRPWRAIKVTEFERRQMAALREELDNEYDDHIGLQTRPLEDKASGKFIQQESDFDLSIVIFCVIG